MKRLLLLIFVSAICAMAFPQKVTGDKSAICKILTKEHKCRVVVQDISKKYNETITTWGYRQGYTSTPLVAKRCCICIHYYVDKDTGGSSYYRDLFIPIEYVTKDIIRKSKFPQNPKRSVRFSGKRTKRSVQKRKARNTQKAETKVL